MKKERPRGNATRGMKVQVVWKQGGIASIKGFHLTHTLVAAPEAATRSMKGMVVRLRYGKVFIRMMGAMTQTTL